MARKKTPSFTEALDAAKAEEEQSVLAKQALDLGKARADARTWKREAEQARGRVTQLEQIIEAAGQVYDAGTPAPAWLTPKAKTKAGKSLATPVLMLSDLHLDEVVDLDEMDGQNEYNRQIAEQRFQRVVDQTVDLLTSYIGGVSYQAMVVGLLGDIVTGEIHDELTATNDAPVMDTLVHWWPILASGLRHIAESLDVRLYVPCVDGNHDRLYKHKSFKKRATSSTAWVMYNAIARELAGDDRYEFEVSESGRVRFPVHDMWFLAEHGDNGARGGHGIGGIWPPILRKVTRDHANMSSAGTPVDMTLMGHWHQLTYGQRFVINSSLKGMDEYARGMGFSAERPQQALFTVVPERGISIRTQVYA